MKDEDITFESIYDSVVLLKRVGKSKVTGLPIIESRFDKAGREIEKIFYNDDGTLTKRIVFEYDAGASRPKVTCVYDKGGMLTFRQERGKPPDLLK